MKTLIFALSLGISLYGAQYALVVSKKVAFGPLSAQQVKEIFLHKRHSLGNEKVIPLNLVGQHDSRVLFEATVLGMDRDRLNAYWVKQHFQGVSPPLTQPSFESIKVFVQNVEGSVGYLPVGMVDSSVKVIYEF